MATHAYYLRHQYDSSHLPPVLVWSVPLAHEYRRWVICEKQYEEEGGDEGMGAEEEGCCISELLRL